MKVIVSDMPSTPLGMRPNGVEVLSSLLIVMI